ncbi:MAG TPA: phasin family protein [Telluria sp.]
MQPFATYPALTSQLETQLATMTELSLRSIDAVRQISELNMQMARQMVDAWTSLGRSMLQTSSPFQLGSATIGGLQPVAEQMRVYQQRLMSVLTGAQADFARSAQAGIPEASRNASALADEMVRNATASASAARYPN